LAFELIDQSGLPDSGFSRYKDDLPLPVRRPSKVPSQLAQRVIPARQSAPARWCGRGRLGLGSFADRGDELVAPSRKSFNISRVLGVVAESGPDVKDVALYGLLLDVSVGPNGFEKFIVRHESAGVLHQVSQDRERRRSQRYPLLAFRTPIAP
jgi:hypothetical protein